MKSNSKLGIKSASDIVHEKLSPEAKNIVARLTNQEKLINYRKFDFRRDNNLEFYFSDYRSLKELFKAIYYRNLSIEDAEGMQDEFDGILGALKKYNPKKSEYVTAKNNLLINAKNLFDGRKMIIDAFKNKIFLLKENEDEHEEFDQAQRPDYESESEIETITKISSTLDEKMFRKHFKYKDLLDMYDKLSKTKNRERNEIQVNVIENNLDKLKNSIENVSDDALVDKLEEIVIAVNGVLRRNEENQEGQGLKILTSQQMLIRLPVSLAQLKAGNNSEKLKNEVRQLLHSLYISKTLNKTIYEHLINPV